MDWELRLVADYMMVDSILQSYESLFGRWKLSNNAQQGISDSEILTIYCFGLRKGLRHAKAIHNFAYSFLRNWFPQLPSYSQFLSRMNSLGEVLRLACFLISKENELRLANDRAIIDSMPIVLASQARSGRAKTAKGLAKKGYCSSKKMYYYGVKLHLVVAGKNQAPYSPTLIVVTPANKHDIEVLKDNIDGIDAEKIIGDKAYISKKLREWAQQLGKTILTPIKKPKNKELAESAKKRNKKISKVRQIVETAFGWIDQLTGIHDASKVRSDKGLLRHIYGALLTAMTAV
jgi:hypothetical protein